MIEAKRNLQRLRPRGRESQRQMQTKEEAMTEVERNIHKDQSRGRDRCKTRGREGKAWRVKSSRGLERQREGAVKKRDTEAEAEKQSYRQG